MIPLFLKAAIFSSSFLLSLCLSSGMALSSSDRMSNTESGKVITGQVLRIEGPNYFVKNKEDAKEVRLQIDKHTQMPALGFVTGDRVKATMDAQNHVLSILPDR
jgi:hypothetical protein